MADAGELVGTPPELQGGYVADMEAALERARQGKESTEADQECFRVTAECIDSLYDGSIVPTGVPADFDRDTAFKALKTESADPRSLAASMSATLAVMAEGYTVSEEDLEEVRRVITRYRTLHPQANWW